MEEPSGPRARDLVFEVLSTRRRRRLLAHMNGSGRDVFEVDELAEMLAEESGGGSEGPTNRRERARVELHHKHLPKMEDAGVLEYDARTEQVRYRGASLGTVDLGLLLAERDEADSVEQ
jgi:hypothetical protein